MRTPESTPQVGGDLRGLRTARPTDLETLVAIDDATEVLYRQHGLRIQLTPEHPFVRAERERWRRAIAEQAVFVAETQGECVGFAALHRIDAEPYLDQLSVLPQHGRRGWGTRLLGRAIEWAREQGGARLWLTTYAHLPFNAPFYARAGFVEAPDAEHGPELRAVLEAQRAALPAPEQRIAMRRPLGSTPD